MPHPGPQQAYQQSTNLLSFHGFDFHRTYHDSVISHSLFPLHLCGFFFFPTNRLEDGILDVYFQLEARTWLNLTGAKSRRLCVFSNTTREPTFSSFSICLHPPTFHDFWKLPPSSKTSIDTCLNWACRLTFSASLATQSEIQSNIFILRSDDENHLFYPSV